MANLVILQGPNAGRIFSLDRDCSLISRNPDAHIPLASNAVSRRHAQVLRAEGVYFIEDLGSANGTFVNGERVAGSRQLQDGDELTISDCVLAFQQPTVGRIDNPSHQMPDSQVEAGSQANILEQVDARASNPALFAENPEKKLQTVLLLAQQLGQTLERDPLLDMLLQNLLDLFPLADRGLVVLCEGNQLIVKGQRVRRRGDADFTFSRTVIRKAIEAGRGILSEDIHGDQRFDSSSSLAAVETKSLLCVPLLGHEGKALGAIQLDCLQPGRAFNGEDLRLLTTLSLMAAVVLENVELNVVRTREETLRRELAVGREIQLGFLPTDFAPPPGSAYEIFASIHPAKEVSGDLYDFFPLPDGRLAFLVGDVSDKGIPAVMFMVKVQTFVRHLSTVTGSPSETLARLNDALTLNNPSSMFVTLVLGLYDPRTGATTLASGGHPRPLLRRADNQVVELEMTVGRLLGGFEGDPGARDVHLTLGHGETLIMFSDGYTEAAAPGTRQMFGLDRLKLLMGGTQTQAPLPACAETARLTVQRFIGSTDLQDDLTLLLLRRVF